LLACVLCLTEGEATIPPHSLSRPYLLDGFLEPYKLKQIDCQFTHVLNAGRSRRTVLAEGDNQEYYTFVILELYDTKEVDMSGDS
jgi:hypothetical protein